MPQFYYHYTSRENAQRIIPLGKLKASRSGQRLWLTEDFYNRGVDAAKNLSIPTEVIEVVCVIPSIDIDNTVLLSARRAADPAPWDPARDKTGGGSEYYTVNLGAEINVSHAAWIELASP